MKQISPELFTYELYEPSYWQRLGLEYSDFSSSRMSDEVIKHAEGWCDASRLLVRPKSGQIAVMCVDSDGDKFWFHAYRNAFQETEEYDESNSSKADI